MRVFTQVFTSALLFCGICSGVAATTVQFSYTSNAVDDAVFAAHFEDWEAAYLKTVVFGGLDGPLRQAQVVLEVDCDIQGGVYDCGRSANGFNFVASPQSFYNSAFSADDFTVSGDVTVVSLEGFVESAINDFTFVVGASGAVEEWGGYGSEFMNSGDFQFGLQGDQFGFSTNAFVSHNTGFEIGAFYCEHTHGVSLDYMGGGDTCTNGMAAVSSFAQQHILDVGVGTWSMLSMEDPTDGNTVIPAPLPAGMPLMLAGLGILAAARRRAA